MYRCLLFLLITLSLSRVTAQPLMTNSTVEQVLLGNYDPVVYQASTVINNPAAISQGINTDVSPDSLHAYLAVLRTFKNRNTCSDTVSATKGIGASRRWIHSKFQQFSAQNQNRLLVSYLEFDVDNSVCQITKHKNVLAVLPGMDTSDKSIVIIEGHMDSRCADNFDTACLAEGMEDNGSGTALVMELARVMSKYSFNHTIVFTTVTGEEQGLIGADSFASYVKQKAIKVKAVLNNDVIGGVICGQTSSPPSCPGHNNIDSTHVRLFSQGSFNSPHKQLARYVKLEYNEMLQSSVSVPMGIHIMTPEDRTGRGGDHIPFRQKGYTAIRFTSANEHGNADASNPNYIDRQHTSTDILGVDTNGDTIIDSFFVDFNYLARNAVINGNAAGMAAISAKTPDLTWLPDITTIIKVQITDQTQYPGYRVAIRSLSPVNNDWDSVYTFGAGTVHTVQNVTPGQYAVSVASVDSKGVESLFSKEILLNTNVKDLNVKQADIELLQNSPNPFDESTMITVLVNKQTAYKSAFISIKDIAGKEVKRLQVALHEGINEVLFEHGYHAAGTFVYTLFVDGKPLQSRKMVFAN
jgi:Zn-dependent M28 family amino/carboxypeptidase